MRRSLASHYRIKTAHHLLNIVALKREMDTYSVDGLLKAASTGHSKEACLRYAGLHAALLIEKRAVDSYNFGPDTAAFKNNSPKPAAPAVKPPATRSGSPKPTQMSGFGAPNPVQLKPTSSGGGGGYTGGNYMINTQATGASTAPSNLDRGFFGAIADSQKGPVPTGIPGVSLAAPAGPAPAMNAARTGSLRQAPAPITAGVIPKPTQGNANATSGLGYDPTGSGSAGRVSGTKPTPTKPENDLGSGKFNPNASNGPEEDAYEKKLNEGAATAAASKQKSDEDAYMSSISPTTTPTPVSPQEEIAAQSQGNGRSGRFFNGQGIGQGLQNRGRIFGGRGR